MNCVKLVFSLYNLIFLLTGAGLLGFGLWFRFDSNSANELLDIIKESGTSGTINDDIIKLVHQSAIVLIAFGAFLFLLSLLGYCGAVKESRFLLGFYTVLLVLIVILEIVAAILISYYIPDAKEQTEGFLRNELIERYNNPNDPKFTKSMNTIMENLQCCGITNGTDFESSKYTEGRIPETCCKKEFPGCMQNPTELNSNKAYGCFDKILDQIMSESGRKWAIGVGALIGILELAGIIFACCLYREAKYSFN